MNTETARHFRRLGTLTIFAVYFVILVGGIVRASGAGMGCPDWPTCFGQLIPPTSEAELPENYHEKYAVGYANTDFNVVKTWTEYLNRLTGVTIGFLIFLTLWASRAYLKTDKAVFYLSLSVFLLVGFQGWLGSVVVKTHLHPLMITAHMLLALFIVALLIYAIARSQSDSLQQIDISQLPSRFKTVLIVAMGFTLLQVAMGTQVREAVDLIAVHHNYINREYWRDSFPIIFYVHRSFSAVILFTNLWLAWKIYQSVNKNNLLRRLAYALVGLIITAILAGVSLDRLGMPPVAQPIHLLMANLIFGIQFFIFICIRYAAKKPSVIATPQT
ncbi:COX15/CtaA family protein [methanotrophic endosymbiont of Bathymodiolus puteoserpentis (Logatchev)]|jgi:cytochrome c oxidase assembly protein subunit 15|uniref:COX15/CtaA family protein n=1 Tax=methanotrophic endosymbiont of Bathymodiolus puteoserpentis (Logatchev) TaxID=343235 RepID=UPI0013CC7C58|nr:COX15/CtaA family protein [methanotrophic endosymbiont of Bathymodiolus puteoserpentis (Logatchev)]SHE20498.1 Heme A synthase, cytochrome oxidase biogenesis protein Cox15-CtaA [methanotrophic endosymbiont of Bathymodiolus puteoserpentis (Logatchev)]